MKHVIKLNLIIFLLIKERKTRGMTLNNIHKRNWKIFMKSGSEDIETQFRLLICDLCKCSLCNCIKNMPSIL